MVWEIAGHYLEETSQGRRCTRVDYQGNQCWAPWSHVRTATLDDVGKPGYCHQGNMTHNEYCQIEMAKVKEEAAVWDAVIAASSGAMPVAAVADEDSAAEPVDDFGF